MSILALTPKRMVFSTLLVCQVFLAVLTGLNLWAEVQYARGNVLAAVTIHPWSWRYQFKAGALFLRAGRHDLAVEPLTVAWKLFPGYWDAGNNLAVALAGVGKKQEAVSVLREIIHYWPHEMAMRNLERINAN